MITRDALQTFARFGAFTQRAFELRFGLTPAGGRPCIRRLTGRACLTNSRNPCDCEGDFGQDHLYAFRRSGEPTGALAAVVWFPYWAEPAAAARCRTWCEANQIEATVLPRGTGWYGGAPDLQTYMVVLWRAWPIPTRQPLQERMSGRERTRLALEHAQERGYIVVGRSTWGMVALTEWRKHTRSAGAPYIRLMEGSNRRKATLCLDVQYGNEDPADPSPAPMSQEEWNSIVAVAEDCRTRHFRRWGYPEDYSFGNLQTKLVPIETAEGWARHCVRVLAHRFDPQQKVDSGFGPETLR